VEPAIAPQPVEKMVGHDRHDRGRSTTWRKCLPTTWAPDMSAPLCPQRVVRRSKYIVFRPPLLSSAVCFSQRAIGRAVGSNRWWALSGGSSLFAR
jgi:hypothetical protein